jgi:DNA primase
MSMNRGRFDRTALPGALIYFDWIGNPLQGHGAWRNALCPFHEDTRPSLRVRADTGAYRCMVCGAHGGDVLDLHQQRTGKGFVDAARELGAWKQ